MAGVGQEVRANARRLPELNEGTTVQVSRELFSGTHAPRWLGRRAVVLPGYAIGQEEALLAAIKTVSRDAPFRNMQTRRGHTMSVAMTNCGRFGWVSDRRGYRYAEFDPTSGARWPPMPLGLSRLAHEAAKATGFENFHADSCLINRYKPGTRLSLHQDRDEGDFDAPIVSISFGLPAVFLWGGLERNGPVRRVPLIHGDVVVWGGPDRLRFHGVQLIKPGVHPLLGPQRINLTLRKPGPRSHSQQPPPPPESADSSLRLEAITT